MMYFGKDATRKTAHSCRSMLLQQATQSASTVALGSVSFMFSPQRGMARTIEMTLTL
jgi:hypothetical protein